MTIVHFPKGKQPGPTTVEFEVNHETAQRLTIIPDNYLEEIERKFNRLVALEYDRWQETMV